MLNTIDMKQEDLREHEYKFRFDDKIDFSKNITRLTNLLSFKNILWITDQEYDSENTETFFYPKKFYINSISLLGNVPYIKEQLSVTYKMIKENLKHFAESNENLQFCTVSYTC